VPTSIHDVGKSPRFHRDAQIDPLADAEPLDGKDVAELVDQAFKPARTAHSHVDVLET
jgi:hypothetical protein